MKYIGHMTITKEITVEFEGNFTDEKRPYYTAQVAALYAAQDQGLIDTPPEGGISNLWIENVHEGKT